MQKKSNDRVEKLIFSVNEELARLTASEEEIKELLNFKNRFHQYSLRNMTLVQKQFEGAVAVGSFQFWKEQGFHVKKGEKGIEILIPVTVQTFQAEDGKSKSVKYATKEEQEKINRGEIKVTPMTRFKVGHVFDITQTNAQMSALPKLFPKRWLDGEVENYQLLYQGLEKIGRSIGSTISISKEELGTSRGRTLIWTKDIELNKRNSELQNVKTILHELGHAKLHTRENYRRYSRQEQEFQAELIAYSVCSYFDLDVSDYSLSYLKGWTQHTDIPTRTQLLVEVYDTAQSFIQSLESHLIEERQKLEQQQNQSLTSTQSITQQQVINDDTLVESMTERVKQVSQDLVDLANERGLSVKTLMNAGAESNEQWLTFPVCDDKGEVVGVASRRKDNENNQLPKWKLSPNFPKKDVLYLYHESQYAIAQSKQVIIVEGILDALSFKEAGFNHVVGLMGASLSDEQLARLLKAGANQYLIAIDHDLAGFKAGLKIEQQLKAKQPNAHVYFIDLGHHNDPNELLQAVGVEGFKQWISAPNPFTKTKLSHILTQPELGECHHAKNPLSIYGQATSQFLSATERKYEHEPNQQLTKSRQALIQLKRDLNILDFCQDVLGLSLQSVGRGEYQAICPTTTHQEKTPSFFVSETKQCFKCFGCGAGGDVIQLAKQSLVNHNGQSLSFKETLDVLYQYRQSLSEPIIQKNQQRYDERIQVLKSHLTHNESLGQRL